MATVTITIEIPNDRGVTWGEVRDGLEVVTPASSTLPVGPLSAPINVMRGGVKFTVEVEA